MSWPRTYAGVFRLGGVMLTQRRVSGNRQMQDHFRTDDCLKRGVLCGKKKKENHNRLEERTSLFHAPVSRGIRGPLAQSASRLRSY